MAGGHPATCGDLHAMRLLPRGSTKLDIAALTQALIVFGPVRNPVPLLLELVPTRVVEFMRHQRYPIHYKAACLLNNPHPCNNAEKKRAISMNYELGEKLLRAACAGHTETVVALLNAGVNPNQTDQNGNTALIAAAYSGHTETVVALLNAGANPNQPNQYGETELTRAAGSGRTETVVALLNAGVNPNQTDQRGKTALKKAADGGHTQTVDALIEAGANTASDGNILLWILLAFLGVLALLFVSLV